MESLSKYWSDRTTITSCEVVYQMKKTLLFGFLKIWRQRVYILPQPGAHITPDTPTQTFRTLAIGSLRFTYQLPVFVENWLGQDLT